MTRNTSLPLPAMTTANTKTPAAVTTFVHCLHSPFFCNTPTTSHVTAPCVSPARRPRRALSVFIPSQSQYHERGWLGTACRNAAAGLKIYGTDDEDDVDINTEHNGSHVSYRTVTAAVSRGNGNSSNSSTNNNNNSSNNSNNKSRRRSSASQRRIDSMPSASAESNEVDMNSMSDNNGNDTDITVDSNTTFARGGFPGRSNSRASSFDNIDNRPSPLDELESDNNGDGNDLEVCLGQFMISKSLLEHQAERERVASTTGGADLGGGMTNMLINPEIDSVSSRTFNMNPDEWSDMWALAVDRQKGFELKNQYSRVGILIEHNFSDFTPDDGCMDAFHNASIEDIAFEKARLVYEATGLPSISEMTEMSIDPPESGSRINKSLQQGYYTRNVAKEAEEMFERVRPISDENRMTMFNTAAVYYDGESTVIGRKTVTVVMLFASAAKSLIATSGALDELYKELTKKFGLTMSSTDGLHNDGRFGMGSQSGKRDKRVMIGATLLRERILREGKILGDGIIKVSSFLNHMVDTDLIEVCGEELAERLRGTAPNKILTVESTGLIAGLPVARKLGIPLVFARKSRPITISDSFQTTYRSATKGVTSELIVSCEYLESGDRVLIVDDFLAGGSTAEGLFKLAKMAHAEVVGVGVLIEKMSDSGRTFLSGYDVPVESLAKVSAQEGSITVVEEMPWTPPNSKLNKNKIRTEARRKAAKYYARTEDLLPAVTQDGVEVVTQIGGRREEGEEGENGELVTKLDLGLDMGRGRNRGGLVEDEDEEDEDDEDVVNVLRWEDDDDLDDIEEGLVRQ